MNSTEAIAAALIKYLQTAPDARGPIDMETDLLDAETRVPEAAALTQ